MNKTTRAKARGAVQATGGMIGPQHAGDVPWGVIRQVRDAHMEFFHGEKRSKPILTNHERWLLRQRAPSRQMRVAKVKKRAAMYERYKLMRTFGRKAA